MKKHLRIDCSLMPGNAAIPSGSRHPTLRVRALLGQRRGHADTELERYAAISEAIQRSGTCLRRGEEQGVGAASPRHTHCGPLMSAARPRRELWLKLFPSTLRVPGPSAAWRDYLGFTVLKPAGFYV